MTMMALFLLPSAVVEGKNISKPCVENGFKQMISTTLVVVLHTLVLLQTGTKIM